MSDKVVTLGEILPEQGTKDLTAALNRGVKTAKEFKTVLEPYRAYLQEREVDVSYLAYYLEYATTTGKLS